MRAIVAASCAGLAGLLLLVKQDDPPAVRAPSGRAAARSSHKLDAGAQSAGAQSTEGDGGAADAGTTAKRERATKPLILGDPPGSVRLSNSSDAAADPPPATDTGARVDRLEREVAALRSRAAALEQQLARARRTAEQLEQLNDQMADLRAQVADEVSRKEDAQVQLEQQRQAAEQAVSGLIWAQRKLAEGGGEVDPALDAAEAALSGEARRNVAAAREALRDRDLSRARYFLGLALSNAQQY